VTGALPSAPGAGGPALSRLAAEAADRLRAAGIAADEARRDAALLARRLLGWDEAQWIAGGRAAAAQEFEAAFAGVVARRGRREPIAYITGEREFFGRPFHVSPAVLIPRPETELVVEAALAELDARDPARPLRVADVGTGSGCLAVTLALERAARRVTATDTSSAALDVARANARRHGVEDRIDFRLVSLLDGLGDLDLVVSNPPYVPERDRASLAPEVVQYEPAAALFAGPDGLDVIRALVPEARRALAPGGALILEFGRDQSAAVHAIVADTAGLALEAVHADLQGHPRVAVVRRADPPAPVP
jgi:release factor glutamine methyltransferase